MTEPQPGTPEWLANETKRLIEETNEKLVESSTAFVLGEETWNKYWKHQQDEFTKRFTGSND